MLSKPYTLDCETTEEQISSEFDADDDDEEDDEIYCDEYPEPKCIPM